MDNQRHFSRVPFSLKAGIDCQGQKTEGQISNLSLQGLFVQIQPGFQPGVKLELTLQLEGKSSNLIIHVQGTVVRITSEGVAVQFDQVDLDSFIHLRNILAYQTGDVNKIDEEFMKYIQARESFLVYQHCEPFESAH